jgi:hypothetical protein
MNLNANVNSKFIIYKDEVRNSDYWSNVANENVLLATYNLKDYADLTDSMVQYIASAYPSESRQKTRLQDYLQGSGRMVEIDESRVIWRLKGSGRVEAISKGNLMQGNPTPGVQGSEILLWLDSDRYVDGDTLSPENLGRDVQVIIKGLPVGQGDGFLYTGELATTDPTEYLDPISLEDGIRWIKSGSSKYSEGSSNYGSQTFGGLAYVEFGTYLNKTGKKMDFTDEAHKVNLRAVQVDDKKAPMMDMPAKVINWAEVEFLADVKWEKEQDLFYGRATRTSVDPSTGLERRVAPGITEYMRDGNVIYYPYKGFNIDMFVDYLNSVWFDRLSNGANIKVYTGKDGRRLFHEGILAKYGDSAVITDYADVVMKTGDYTLGLYNKEFNAYRVPFYGGVITVEEMPILNSTWLGGPKNPETGNPLTSSEFLIFDYGLGNGMGSNIQLIKRRNSEIHTYICGTYSPAGPNQGSSKFPSTHFGRYYSLVHGDEYGVRIKDITLTAWFRPAVQ